MEKARRRHTRPDTRGHHNNTSLVLLAPASAVCAHSAYTLSLATSCAREGGCCLLELPCRWTSPAHVVAGADRCALPKLLPFSGEVVVVVVVGWSLNVPATCECISGTDLLRQFYVLIKLSISPGHSTLTPGRPVPALTL